MGPIFRADVAYFLGGTVRNGPVCGLHRKTTDGLAHGEAQTHTLPFCLSAALSYLPPQVRLNFLGHMATPYVA